MVFLVYIIVVVFVVLSLLVTIMTASLDTAMEEDGDTPEVELIDSCTRRHGPRGIIILTKTNPNANPNPNPNLNSDPNRSPVPERVDTGLILTNSGGYG